MINRYLDPWGNNETILLTIDPRHGNLNKNPKPYKKLFLIP